jgi:error-prone DNA polymerase
MVEGLAAKGYDREFAARCFRQIEGFGEYGFPESHAASFALLVYASCWLKCRYPDVFLAAMLNAQPLGFYSPSQLVRDAREHGVEAREVDVNFSDWDATLEPHALTGYGPSSLAGEGPRRGDEGAFPDIRRVHKRHAAMTGDILATHAVRLGLRQITGAREEEIRRLVERRGAGYDSVRDLWLRGGVTLPGLEKLAEADAFRSMGLDRREALWAVKALNRVGDQDDLPLFAAMRPERDAEPDAKLPPMPLGAHVVEDYRRLSLSLKAHPVAFMRSRLAARGILRSDALEATPGGQRVTVAGLVLVRQRPGTAKGVIFMTIEDEAGVANIIVWPKVFERMRALVIGARFVAASGRLQNERGVIHLVAEKFEDWTPALGQLAGEGRPLDALGPADEMKRPALPTKVRPSPRLPEPRPAPLAPELKRALPGGRNFH